MGIVKTIALDFDGVLHSYKSGWMGYSVLEEPVEGAQDFVKSLKDKGFRVVIFTLRAKTAKGIDAVKKWLEDYKFPSDIPVVIEKPQAVLYVDDRGYRFEGKFSDVLDYIENKNPSLETWNR